MIPGHLLFSGLDRDGYKEARKSVVDMVLATDMTKHFEHLSKFVNMVDKCSMTKDETDQYEVALIYFFIEILLWLYCPRGP